MDVAAEQNLSLLHDWRRSSDEQARTRPGRLARALLRYIAAECGSFPDATAWEFGHAPGGRPLLLVRDANAAGISLSHSGNWVAGGIRSDGPLGIDIEIHRSGRDLRGIAAYSFGPQERQRCWQAPEEFYRIWTLREAIAKASGRGLVQVTNGLDYVATGPLKGISPSSGLEYDCLLIHSLPAPGISLSVAAPATVSVGTPAITDLQFQVF